MPTVLNFFASWCPPCIAEMPDFEAVSQQMAGQVQFIGLATQDDPARAALLIEQTGVSYEIGLDRNGKVFELFDGFAMPTTVFLTSDGSVMKVQEHPQSNAGADGSC